MLTARFAWSLEFNALAILAAILIVTRGLGGAERGARTALALAPHACRAPRGARVSPAPGRPAVAGGLPGRRRPPRHPRERLLPGPCLCRHELRPVDPHPLGCASDARGAGQPGAAADTRAAPVDGLHRVRVHPERYMGHRLRHGRRRADRGPAAGHGALGAFLVGLLAPEVRRIADGVSPWAETLDLAEATPAAPLCGPMHDAQPVAAPLRWHEWLNIAAMVIFRQGLQILLVTTVVVVVLVVFGALLVPASLQATWAGGPVDAMRLGRAARSTASA